MNASATSKAGPTRTCVGCRKTFQQARLLRFVRSTEGWKADREGKKGKQPGRGTYLCSGECAEKVAKNRKYPGLASAAAEYGLIRSSLRTDGTMTKKTSVQAP